MKESEDSIWHKILIFVIPLLLLFGGLKVYTDLYVDADSCQQGNPNSTGLANLYQLPGSIDPNASPVADLRNATYMAMVNYYEGRTLVGLANQTVFGFLQDSASWKNWTATNFGIQPSWLDEGPMPFLGTELAAIRSEALNSTSGAQALGYVTNFATSVAGFDLASLDYISLNGLTAIKTLLATGSSELALCATMPGQIAELYQMAFDPSIVSQERAQYLGEALAITGVIGLTAGIGGFSDQFKEALWWNNLDGAWDTTKPYIAQLGAISPDTANLALVVLQKLATQYPSMGTSEAGLVTFRIEGMAEVLSETGDSTSDINAKIQSLGNDAGSGATPDDIANEADEISIDDGKGVQAIVGAGQHLFYYSDASTKQYFDPEWLQTHVPGFSIKTPAFLKVYYFPDQEFTFNYYSGGDSWTATVPSDLAKVGDQVTVYIQILSLSDFVDMLPKIDFSNDAGFRWMPQSAELDTFTLTGNRLTISGSESPNLSGTSIFSFQTQVQGSLQFAPGQGAYLQVGIPDIFGQVRSMRIYYGGYGDASIHLQGGAKFPTVSMVSFDGVRLNIVYGSPTLSIATIYETSPVDLYSLGEVDQEPLNFQIQGVSQVTQIQQVSLVRQFEMNMLGSSSNYALSRLGAEIAYTVGTEKLGLSNLVIGEPSQGGPDLWTQDGTTVLEARMLGSSASADAAGQGALDALLQKQLTQMVSHIIKTDFAVYPQATVGYAILTYLDANGNLHTIILEVSRS